MGQPLSRGAGAPKADRQARALLFYSPCSEDPTPAEQGSPGLLPFLGALMARGLRVELFQEVDALVGRLGLEKEAIVGLSSQEILAPETVAALRRVRLAAPDNWIAVGGPLAEHYVEAYLDAGADMVLTGEAEITFPLVLDLLPRTRPASRGMPWPIIRQLQATVHPRTGPQAVGVPLDNLFVRDDQGRTLRIGGRDGRCRSEIVGAAVAPTEEEMRASFVYPWDLFRRHGWARLNLQAQRGCPWGRCSFCASPKAALRRLAPRQVLAVVEQALQEGVEVFAFADDVFLQDPTWSDQLLQGLIRLPIRAHMELIAQSRVEPELEAFLPRLAEAGFITLALGVETLIPSRAALYHKYRDPERGVSLAGHLVCKTAEAGIIPQVNVILSDPTSDLETIAEELALLCELADAVHERTGIAPTFAVAPTTRPSKASALSKRYAYYAEKVNGVSIPAEFVMPDPVADLINEVGQRTTGADRYGASFEHLEVLMACLCDCGGGRHLSEKAGQWITRGRAACERIRQRFDRQFAALLGEPAGDEACSLPPEHVVVTHWLRGYKAGVDRLLLLAQSKGGS